MKRFFFEWLLASLIVWAASEWQRSKIEKLNRDWIGG